LAETDPGAAWFQELDRLTQRVEGLFRQATRRFAAPSADGCRSVAFYLMALRSHREMFPNKPLRQTKAIRYGKLFLHHLAAERQEPAYWIALSEQGRPVKFWLRRYQELLCRIDRVRAEIETLLAALTLPRDERDPIRVIAEAAKAAWKETNSGRTPRSTNPEDPLCKFVVEALQEIGQYHRAASVSAVLSGRRRKPKDGQKP
jgi:hypothetical protein